MKLLKWMFCREFKPSPEVIELRIIAEADLDDREIDFINKHRICPDCEKGALCLHKGYTDCIQVKCRECRHEFSLEFNNHLCLSGHRLHQDNLSDYCLVTLADDENTSKQKAAGC